MSSISRRLVLAFVVGAMMVGAVAGAGNSIHAQSPSPRVTPNGAYTGGVNAVVVQGAGSSADVATAIQQDSGRGVLALWVLSGQWRYFLPSLPTVNGGLQSFAGPVASAYAVLTDVVLTQPAQVILRETFDNDSNQWGSVSDATIDTAIFGGALRWQFKVPDASYTQWPDALLTRKAALTNVRVEADVTTADADAATFLLCRYDESTDAGYVLSIGRQRGRARIIKQGPQPTGTLTDLVVTPDGSVTIPDGQTTLHLRADCQATATGTVKLALYLNGSKVAEAEDRTSIYQQGTIAIGADSGGGPGLFVWDNVVVTDIGPAR